MLQRIPFLSLKKALPVLLVLTTAPILRGQNSTDPSPRLPKVDPAVQLANTIQSDDLKRHLTILASDEFEGRETGTDGQRKAAAYLAERFAELGLPALGDEGSYFQKISFRAENWEDIQMEVNGEGVRHLWDYYAFPAFNSDRDWATIAEVVFLGYGIDDDRYSDYRNTDVKGKAILIYDGEPRGAGNNFLLSGTKDPSEWSTDITAKLRAAKQHGVSTVFIIDSDFKKNVAEARRTILSSRLSMGWGEQPEKNFANSVFLSTEVARRIIGDAFQDVVKARKRIEKKAKLKPVSIPCNMRLRQQKKVRELIGENVLGYLEGTDPQLKDELVVVTAHYDHLGRRGDDIFNGADDNGSGTSTVLEICQAFVDGRNRGLGPRRSVLFMLVSGEEKGLLGSQYYVEHPVFPLEHTVVNVNVDMIGRVDKKHEGNPNYIYVIGSDRLSTELHQINETANDSYTQLELDYTYNAEDDPNRYYYRSDHYNFAERGIPAIFYFSGTHKDYHRPSDTVEKIDFAKMARIGQLIFHTTWELANRDVRIRVDVPEQGE